MAWSELHSWWTEEIEEDPAYESVVTPLLFDVLDPASEKTYLDLGCGEGRVMRQVSRIGALPIGVDLVGSLARLAVSAGPVVQGELPSLAFLRASSVDGAYCVLVLEHIQDEMRFFTEVSRVVKPLGVLALVINHPVWTSPGSTPVTDDDGEVLWRPGAYFDRGWSREPAGESNVTFHHRSMGQLLTAASSAGWRLEKMLEQPHHEYDDQSGIPRFLACRWQLLPSS